MRVEIDVETVHALADLVDGRYYTEGEIEYDTGVSDRVRLGKMLKAVSAITIISLKLKKLEEE